MTPCSSVTGDNEEELVMGWQEKLFSQVSCTHDDE